MKGNNPGAPLLCTACPTHIELITIIARESACTDKGHSWIVTADGFTACYSVVSTLFRVSICGVRYFLGSFAIKQDAVRP
jgi:hypothetical protein